MFKPKIIYARIVCFSKQKYKNYLQGKDLLLKDAHFSKILFQKYGRIYQNMLTFNTQNHNLGKKKVHLSRSPLDFEKSPGWDVERSKYSSVTKVIFSLLPNFLYQTIFQILHFDRKDGINFWEEGLNKSLSSAGNTGVPRKPLFFFFSGKLVGWTCYQLAWVTTESNTPSRLANIIIHFKIFVRPWSI